MTESLIVAPCYHLIADVTPCHVRHLYPHRSVVGFERELDWLLARFEPIGLEQVFAWRTHDKELPRKSLFLSFDDGFREMAEVVAPICKRKGVPVTFFLTTDFLDNRKLGFRHKASLLLEVLSRLLPDRAAAIVRKSATMNGLECGVNIAQFVLGVRHADSKVLDDAADLAGLDFQEYLRTQRPYLSSAQIRELVKDGFSIGAHSCDHPRYSEVSLQQQIDQTRDSVGFLEKHFGLTLRAFAFPFVSDGVSEEFYSRAFSERICDLIFSIGGWPGNWDWPVVERFGVERGTNEPIWTILRDMNRRQLRTHMSRFFAPLRELVG